LRKKQSEQARSENEKLIGQLRALEAKFNDINRVIDPEIELIKDTDISRSSSSFDTSFNISTENVPPQIARSKVDKSKLIVSKGNTVPETSKSKLKDLQSNNKLESKGRLVRPSQLSNKEAKSLNDASILIDKLNSELSSFKSGKCILQFYKYI
jgi:hypothetical protein